VLREAVHNTRRSSGVGVARQGSGVFSQGCDQANPTTLSRVVTPTDRGAPKMSDESSCEQDFRLLDETEEIVSQTWRRYGPDRGRRRAGAPQARFLLLVLLLILFLLRSDRLLLVTGALGYFAFGGDIGLRDHVWLLRFIWHASLLGRVSPGEI
jgi:hypothetical protein